MKKLIIASLFIFWSVVAAIFVSGLISNQEDNAKLNNPAPADNGAAVQQADKQSSQPVNATSTPVNAKTEPKPKTTTPPPAPKPSEPAPLSAAGVAKHNSAGDCWLIISGKIYDVTSYLSRHPGGAGTITPYCGREATRAFQTKDAGRPHSSYAESLLGDYFIGNLVK